MGDSKESVLLDVRNLKKYFPIRGGVLNRTVGHVKAVEDVSFTVGRTQTFALVGESGCGKSTTGRTLLRLLDPTGGSVLFGGTDLAALKAEELRVARKDMQMIFQNPYGSLNPRMKIRKLLAEPLETHTSMASGEVREAVRFMLERVGLAPEYGERYPHQFSGGQRQRVAIARALMCSPSLVVADEPVSALDVSIQSQIINLLLKLQSELELTYIFISHDMNVVRHISDRIGVMYLGKIVEIADTAELFAKPLHPYTQALLSAVPSIKRGKNKTRIILEGDVPNPVHPPEGCHFHPRCRYAVERCRTEVPALRDLSAGHRAACHLA